MVELKREDYKLSSGVGVTFFHKFPKRGLQPLDAFKNWLNNTDNPTTQNFVNVMRAKGFEIWTKEERLKIIEEENEGLKRAN